MHQHTLSSSQRAWLTLASAVDVPTGKWLALLDAYDCKPEDIVNANQKQNGLPEGEPFIKKISNARVTDAISWCEASDNRHIVTYACDSYPKQLHALDNPPLVLFVVGKHQLLANPSVAIVGSRRASHQGKQIAHNLSMQLAQQGVTVVSGMAMGIDASAHQGALSERASTIAITGTGPDNVYPPKNIQLHAQITEQGGACITEFFPKVTARAWHFPRRNRIIAALTLGTVVVEAKIKSGTLITANLAANIGREVFAVPSSIFNTHSEGCHWLIQQGAKLITNVDDIIDEIAVQPLPFISKADTDSKKSEVNNLATDTLLDSVDYDITAIDVIAQRSATPVNQVMAVLLEYELRGLVTAVPGGYVKLRGK